MLWKLRLESLFKYNHSLITLSLAAMTRRSSIPVYDFEIVLLQLQYKKIPAMAIMKYFNGLILFVVKQGRK
jgi:hypothetical protein